MIVLLHGEMAVEAVSSWEIAEGNLQMTLPGAEAEVHPRRGSVLWITMFYHTK